MKKIYILLQLCLAGAVVILTPACQRENLSEVLSKEELPVVQLSVDNMIEISGGKNYTLDNNQVTVPVTIKLSGVSGKAFSVDLRANQDTIAALKASGKLPADAVALTQGSYLLPSVLDIAHGVQSLNFDLAISRTFIEKYYGRTIVLAVKLTDAAKGNTLSPNSNIILVIKSPMVMAESEVHYVMFNQPGDKIMVPDGSNYTLGSADVTVPIPLKLTGLAGTSFTVNVDRNTDTIKTLIANGSLPNTVTIENRDWSISSPVTKFDANTNTAALSVTALGPAVFSVVGKKVAIAVTLSSPTKWQTKANSRTMIVVFDPAFFIRPFNEKPFLISGKIGVPSAEINAAHYDNGGQGVSYNDDSNRDAGNSTFRPGDKVDIENFTPAAWIGYTNANEWLLYTVVVEEDGEYELNVLAGNPDGSADKYSMFFDNVNVTGVRTLKGTSGWNVEASNISTVTLKKGTYKMKFFLNTGGFNVRGYIFTRLK